uniref:Phytanoyl-CoA dioxygenase n=1 Tax=Globisporangium ultimum (strain ATCC 200006 / CBS 805.95 / DAOM BR144) TaxID=431595 RepID=K3W8I0_GLOUD
MRWEAKHWVALKSLPEGVEQEPHHDFPSFETGHVRTKYQTIQAGAMVWPMPNTKLIAYDSCFTEADAWERLALEFSAGDCIIFRGDLVHAGASFDAMNYRIHCTLTVKGIKWRRDAAETALFKQIKCAYCPFMVQMKLKVRNHT